LAFQLLPQRNLLSGLVKKKFLLVASYSVLILFASTAVAQTFEIGNQPAQTPATTKGNKPSKGKSSASSGESNGIGWGVSVGASRYTRAAEQALRKGDGPGAASLAERATKEAPQNPKLWFLLGYASRLAGRNQQSLDAYQHGLSLEPGNADGLSGMAQTYARMGQIEQAKKLLQQVIRANPKRENDLLVAGELYLQTNDLNEGVNLLSRAEAMRPSAHAEVMMAVAYLKLKQPARAKQLLDQAKRRDPKNPTVFRAVANFYREEHDYKAAIAALKSSPVQNTDVLADLGYSYELNGDKDLSAAAYSKAATMAPKQINLQLSAAQGQIHAGALDKAREFLARAEGLDANHYRLHALRAQIARQENRNADAIKEYQVAISNLPAGGVPEGQLYPIQLHLNLADIYRETGDDAAAKQQIATAEAEVNQLQIEGPARAEFLRVRASIRSADNDFNGAESDLKEALRLDPANLNITLQYANLLWRIKRKDDARKLYEAVLTKDPNNRFGLEAMGYLRREENDSKGAEFYFNKLAAAYPNDYVPYLALGDLHTFTRDFPRAEQEYQHAYRLAPSNPVIVANAANAAIEAGQIPSAADWVGRAKGKMLDDPRVMRERERVLFHQGRFAESARLGQQVLQQLPKDRNASVYLAYDLYNLGRYDDVLSLSERYSGILPKEPNFPLLTGHVHKQNQLLSAAADDYTEAIARDPKMRDAYVNRGYVLNDMQDAEQATKDFNTALQMDPKSGVAHLGLAFSSLQVRHGQKALEETDIAEKSLGESGATHLARATAYRQMRLLDKAEKEFRSALKFAPDDVRLHLALADTEYHMRKYQQSIGTLQDALGMSPDDPAIYSQLAHAYAEMHNRSQTLKYIEAAESADPGSSAVLLNDGEALLTLGDRDAAMQRFTRALDAPDGNRVEARLAFARLFLRDRKFEDARQQVALAFAESRVGESAPVTADDLVEAANIFLAMSDFDLSQKYFKLAHDAGAADEVVAIGMANSYLAQGYANDAQAQLAALGSPDEYSDNFDYNLAMANVYRQRHDTMRALTSFAKASELSGDDEVATRQMQDVAGEAGIQVGKRFGLDSDFLVHGIYDDETIYGLDRQVFAGPAGTAAPPPRSSLETIWTNGYRARFQGWPLLSGFFQVRNARGDISLPSESLILHRNTYDYSINSALNPVLRLGRNSVTFNAGLQFTFRRDKLSPVELNQNLFRQFVFMSTNALGNWLQVQGEAFHESGPFTDRDLSSGERGARIQFTVGRPWGRTALLTEYSIRDLQFHPLVREFWSTTTGIGVQHQFGEKLKLAVLGEYIRSWRTQDTSFWIAQAIRPAAQFSYKASNRWSVDGNFTFSRGEGFHEYDNVQSSFLINYVRGVRRNVSDGVTEVPVEYPLRFSIGVENANYFNFTGRNQTILRPVIRLTLF
jgi:tetratricopeptide (TPR) repeat protein